MKRFSDLTPRGRVIRLRRALDDVLSHYPLPQPRVRFVSNASRPVFQVVSEGRRYAAKFHNPAEHALAQFYAETAYLAHVSPVPELNVERPIANRSGAYVTPVSHSGLGREAHVAVFNWVPGRSAGERVSVAGLRHLGRAAALLHRASRAFQPPADFEILRLDRLFYWDSETILSRRDATLLPPERQALFREAATVAGETIAALWATGDPLVCHNDLHPCNLKIERDALGVIDFEDVAWGYAAQDIGTALYHIRFEADYQRMHDAFRDSYEAVARWPLEDEATLDRCIMARLLMFANYVVNYDIDPQQHLPRYAARVALMLGR